MATTEELKTVVRETLESRGVLGQLKAKIRAEVYHALDAQPTEPKPRPQISDENLLINELIRDYLEFNRYNCTTSVFLAESGQPHESLSRDLLAQELSLTQSDATNSVPLLYHMLAHFKKKASASHSKPHPKPHPPDEAGSLNLQSSHHPSNHSYDNLHSPQSQDIPPSPPSVILQGTK